MGGKWWRSICTPRNAWNGPEGSKVSSRDFPIVADFFVTQAAHNVVGVSVFSPPFPPNTLSSETKLTVARNSFQWCIVKKVYQLVAGRITRCINLVDVDGRKAWPFIYKEIYIWLNCVKRSNHHNLAMQPCYDKRDNVGTYFSRSVIQFLRNEKAPNSLTKHGKISDLWRMSEA